MNTAAGGWSKLQQANRRFVNGEVTHPHQDQARRHELVNGQKPEAVVLTCADSRVCPELLFDAGLGDLFVIRVAGNVVTPEVIGSVEYAVGVLETPLLVVLGHQSCGAVKAAFEAGEPPGEIPQITHKIKPVVPAEANGADTTAVEAAVKANAQLAAQDLVDKSAIISAAQKAGKLEVLAAYYSLATGEVERLQVRS